jgi:hypothetical protein
MSAYAWKITHDHLKSKAVSIYGPADIAEPDRRELDTNSASLSKFRLYDADGELYYSGTFIGDSESEEGFGPLDDYGKPAVGTTEIRYLRNGKWEQL